MRSPSGDELVLVEQLRGDPLDPPRDREEEKDHSGDGKRFCHARIRAETALSPGS